MASIVEQSCILEDYVSLAPNVSIGGRTTIEKYSLIGTGANVFARLKLGSHNVIAAGAIVTKNSDSYSYLKGSPAKYISSTKSNFSLNNFF